MIAYTVAPGPLYTGRAPIRDRAYLKFIRMHSCVACGSPWHIEAAHTGARGLGTRSDDRQALPVCKFHHRVSKNSLHDLGPVKFCRLWNLNVPALIDTFNRWYELEVLPAAGADATDAAATPETFGGAQ